MTQLLEELERRGEHPPHNELLFTDKFSVLTFVGLMERCDDFLGDVHVEYLPPNSRMPANLHHLGAGNHVRSTLRVKLFAENRVILLLTVLFFISVLFHQKACVHEGWQNIYGFL